MDAGSRWDAICVGAGITSLAFGAQLAQRHPGARILVIDKHGVPGGYATVFQRPKAGAAFDCSLHKLSGMGEGGNLRRIFADLGLDAELGLAGTETMIFASGADASRAARATCEQDDACERAYWRDSVMEVTNYYGLDPAGGRIVCPNVLDSMAHWPERRSPAYKLKKARALNVLLERLYAAKPGLRGHVVYTEVSTPRTYKHERFTNDTDGAGYGAMVGTDLSGHVFHHAFPIAGVHLLSAWVAGPSYEAAFGYAEMKAKQWAA